MPYRALAQGQAASSWCQGPLKGSPQPTPACLTLAFVLLWCLPETWGQTRARDLPPPVGASSLHPSHTYCVLSWEPREEDNPNSGWENSC